LHKKIIDMCRTVYTICLLALFTLSSCKDETKTTGTGEVKETAQAEKTIQLSSYTDSNWSSGVSVEYGMFLLENSKSNEELVKGAKELQLSDGTLVKVTGYTVADPFIQLNIEGKASQYQDLAAHPNKIIVK
jgi:hypothetical protein